MVHEAGALARLHLPDLGDGNTGGLRGFSQRREFFRRQSQNDFIVVAAGEHGLDQGRIGGKCLARSVMPE